MSAYYTPGPMLSLQCRAFTKPCWSPPEIVTKAAGFFQRTNLKLREIKSLAPGHTARRWRSQDSSQDLFDSRTKAAVLGQWSPWDSGFFSAPPAVLTCSLGQSSEVWGEHLVWGIQAPVLPRSLFPPVTLGRCLGGLQSME